MILYVLLSQATAKQLSSPIQRMENPFDFSIHIRVLYELYTVHCACLHMYVKLQYKTRWQHRFAPTSSLITMFYTQHRSFKSINFIQYSMVCLTILAIIVVAKVKNWCPLFEKKKKPRTIHDFYFLKLFVCKLNFVHLTMHWTTMAIDTIRMVINRVRWTEEIAHHHAKWTSWLISSTFRRFYSTFCNGIFIK